MIEGFRAAFTDWSILEARWFGGRGGPVASRFRLEAKHTGPLGIIAPTGRLFTVSGIAVSHLRGEKLEATWVEVSALDVFRQLGKFAEKRR